MKIYKVISSDLKEDSIKMSETYVSILPTDVTTISYHIIVPSALNTLLQVFDPSFDPKSNLNLPVNGLVLILGHCSVVVWLSDANNWLLIRALSPIFLTI